VRFQIWRLMIVVAFVACSFGAALAFTVKPNTARNVIVDCLPGTGRTRAIPITSNSGLCPSASVSGSAVG
jgi:hypothetical protein